MKFIRVLARRLVRWPLNKKEIDRIERLKRRAYHLQNKLDNMPRNYDMSYTKAELSALCWAVETISGKPFSTVEAPSIG